MRQRWYTLADLEEPRDCWVYPRSLEWWDCIVMCCWDDWEWMRRFRMLKASFLELVQRLHPCLERNSTTMHAALSLEKRVAVVVWFLASGASYQVGSDLFGMGHSTVASSVLEFCFAVELELLAKTVCLGDDVGKIMECFQLLGFPHCIGTIDGCHIPICAPGGRPEQYGNRKHFSSILLQGTVDHTGIFIDVEVGWSGKNHDAFVFSHSALCSAMDSGTFLLGNQCITVHGIQVPPLIISDGAYPMRRWLMKPFGNTASSAMERHLDRCLCRARNTIERSFRRLKSRWRSLSTCLRAREQNIVSIVTTAVVLHNLCEAKGHPILSVPGDSAALQVEVEAQEFQEPENRHHEEGKVVRRALARLMSGGT
ncbi:uncharacterized protein LOC129335128 [Eublepharis macularius]|uniref:Uncharacterized protein LOC129335128 n=1 Tax=Eublepharis macularius TaxID=481883 RepID=A0AA97JSS5_EUBMA|nr:uncharacterized protein LOC129335128 [Eublepharis macularius]